MGSVTSAVGGFLSASGVWLIAVLLPIARSIARWTAKRRDFDIVTTALLPSILFVLFSAFLVYGTWSPGSLGTSAVWVWISYQPVNAAIVLGGLILLVLLMTAGLLWFGHRCLLGIWRRVPLRRDDSREIPIVDHAGVVACFAETQQRFALVDSAKWWVYFSLLTSRWAVIRPVVQTHNPWPWLSQIELSPSFGDDLSRDAEAGMLIDGFEAKLKECGREADEIIRDARALVQSSISPAKANADKHASSSEPANHAPDPAAVRRIVEDLMDGLSPQFQARHQTLVKAVQSFQQEVCALLREINDRIDQKAFSHACLPSVRRIIDELHTESRDLVWRLALQFGATKEGRYVANSLAFNLEATTLGRWSYWGPLSRYNWKTSLPSTDDEIAKKERRLEKATAELADAAPAEPKVRTVPERTEQWMVLGEVEKLIEKRLSSEEREGRSRTRYRKIVEAAENHAAQLAVMSAVRSKILAYIAFASVVAACGVMAAVMSLTAFGASNLSESMWSAALAGLEICLAMIVARKIFISSVINHAFYLTMAESRLRSVPDQKRPSAFDWRPRRIGDYGRRLIWIGEFAVLFALAVGVHYLATRTGYTDYRLVVAASRPLASGEGITARNLDDLIKVKWQPCDPASEPYRLDDPAKLVDTYAFRRCAGGGAWFGRPDLVFRPHAKKHAWAVPASEDGRCLAPSSRQTLTTRDSPDRKPHAAPPPEGMCLTMVNKPPVPEPGWREKLVTTGSETLREMRRQFRRLSTWKGIAPASPSMQNLVLQTANVQVVSQNVNLNAPASQPPVVAYVEKPAAQTTMVYAILDGKSGEPQRGTPIGSVYFNFNCDGNQPGHCPHADACSEKAAPQDKNDESISAMAAEAAKLAGHDRRLLVVGLTDRPGSSDHNKNLSLRRADYVKRRIVDKVSDKEKSAPLIHTLGIGEGSSGLDRCEAIHRRVDVYVIDSKRNVVPPLQSAAAP